MKFTHKLTQRWLMPAALFMLLGAVGWQLPSLGSAVLAHSSNVIATVRGTLNSVVNANSQVKAQGKQKAAVAQSTTSKSDVAPPAKKPTRPRTPGVAAATNDNCASAITIASLPFTDTKDTNGNTDEAGEPVSTCTDQFNSGWYTYTAGANDVVVTVTTCGSDFDTALMVYRVTGAACAFAGFVPVGCSDDDATCDDGFKSAVSFIAAAGQTYKIQAGGFDGETGSLTLNVTGIEVLCDNIVVNGTLGNGSQDWPSTSGQQTPARLFRDGVPSTCAAPKACPGPFGSGSFTTDAYTFANSSGQPQCVTINFEPNIGCGVNTHAIAYLNSYDRTNLCLNYLADSGSSDDLSFSFTVPAGANVVLVIAANNPGGVGDGCAYKFTVLGNICQDFTPALTASLVDPLACVGQGDLVAGSFGLNNTSGAPQTGTITATLQPTLLALPGTCVANVGTCSVVNPSTVTWTGTLAAGQVLSVSYQAQIANGVPVGTQACATTVATFGTATATVQACLTVNCQQAGPGLVAAASAPMSDQKPGSVLVYNVYTSSTDANRQNTRISLTNTNPTRTAYVHLFFVDGSSCAVADSYICLTANQTASFLASDLDPGTTGYIVAVATDRIGCPINFNYLIGDEYVKFATGHAANLGAESVSAIAGGLTTCNTNSVTATLLFDGVSYNVLPHVLAADNIGSRADGNDSLLIVNRLSGNLSIGASTLGTVFGIFYDDAESALSFSFSGGCQFRGSITNNFPRTVPRFETFVPAGRTGWFKLWSPTLNAASGAIINFNPNAGAAAGAFNQGHNLHKLTNTPNGAYIIPVFPPSC